MLETRIFSNVHCKCSKHSSLCGVVLPHEKSSFIVLVGPLNRNADHCYEVFPCFPGISRQTRRVSECLHLGWDVILKLRLFQRTVNLLSIFMVEQ